MGDDVSVGDVGAEVDVDGDEPVGGTPPVYYQGQNGMLGVFLSPHFATDNMVYLTYVEPGEYGGGLALGRGESLAEALAGKLSVAEGVASAPAVRACILRVSTRSISASVA